MSVIEQASGPSQLAGPAGGWSGAAPSQSAGVAPSAERGSMRVAVDRLLLLAAREAFEVRGDGFSRRVEVGRAIVISRPGRVFLSSEAAGGEPSTAAMLCRNQWQAALMARFRTPKRLRHAATLVACDASLASAIGRASEDEVRALLIDGLAVADRAIGDIWEVSLSLKRATDFILAHPATDCSPGKVASQAGMTLKTLHRQARTYLGMTPAAFVREVRLEAAHRSLCSGRDSRSVGRMAADYGFTSGAAFARAYIGRYGEPPADARARAVRALG